jgi:hypothetical protein
MTAKDNDLFVKAALALAALEFTLSLPSWALGIILTLAAGIKYTADRHRQTERHNEPPPSSPSDTHQPR